MMKILQVSNSDLQGGIYNGHQLQLSLNQSGIMAWQMVMRKEGKEMTTLPLISPQEVNIMEQMKRVEQQIGQIGLLEPFAERIVKSNIFKSADIVHYHLVHNQVISMLDFADVVNRKPSVWTIHDPWLIGGHCTYPLECEQWKTGCGKCDNLEDLYFPMKIDKSHELWKIKKETYEKIEDIDLVVATDWMKQYIEESPLTQHFKRIHKIPFGLNIKKYSGKNREEIRENLEIPENHCVLLFRYSGFEVKGVHFILEALKSMEVDETVTILTLGDRVVWEEEIKRKYRIIELGWQQEDGVIEAMVAADIFIMPSLAESFGLMAIEAMAAKCTVVVFEHTVLEQITYAPECGVSVKYRDSIELEKTIKQLILNPNERQWRGEAGYKIVSEKYRYEDYVKRHIDLYKEIHQRNADRKPYYERKSSDSGEREMKLEEGMYQIHNFHKKLDELTQGKTNGICIFGAGVYGRITYRILKDRIVNVKYVVDNDKNKWGWAYIKQNWPSSYNDIECVGMQYLEREEVQPLIIVANKSPEDIVSELKDKGFFYIITRQELDVLLKDVPGLMDLNDLEGIQDLDYSSTGVQTLIRTFNRTVADFCAYYEKR